MIVILHDVGGSWEKSMCFIQDPAINIAELKDIHSEINLTVPDPILLSNLHDGLEAVRLQHGT